VLRWRFIPFDRIFFAFVGVGAFHLLESLLVWFAISLNFAGLHPQQVKPRSRVHHFTAAECEWNSLMCFLPSSSVIAHHCMWNCSGVIILWRPCYDYRSTQPNHFDDAQ
jgi:hypothetical protein